MALYILHAWEVVINELELCIHQVRMGFSIALQKLLFFGRRNFKGYKDSKGKQKQPETQRKALAKH